MAIAITTRSSRSVKAGLDFVRLIVKVLVPSVLIELTLALITETRPADLKGSDACEKPTAGIAIPLVKGMLHAVKLAGGRIARRDA
jgi:hypothetical protein